MNTLYGDLIQFAENGQLDVIIHGCNCMCTMGAGIAKTIKNKYPAAYAADLKTKNGDRNKLGTYSSVKINIGSITFIIVNGYTQYDWRGSRNKADYEAIKKLFQTIKIDFSGKKIGYPKIGCGLAGGSWDVVSKIIENELTDELHYYVEFSQ